MFKKAAPERRLSSAGMSGDLEGVTVLAWGAQVPDCLASISMAKKGLGPGPARRGREFCHSADALSPSLLIHLPKAETGAAE